MEALLNDEGKKHWGEIFPNGEVPVKTIVPQDAEIEGKNQPLKVYLVNLGYPHKKTARRYPAVRVSYSCSFVPPGRGGSGPP